MLQWFYQLGNRDPTNADAAVGFCALIAGSKLYFMTITARNGCGKLVVKLNNAQVQIVRVVFCVLKGGSYGDRSSAQ